MALFNIYKSIIDRGIQPIYRGEAVPITQEGFERLNAYIEALEYEAVKLHIEGVTMADELCTLDKTFESYRVKNHEGLNHAQVSIMELEVANLHLRHALEALLDFRPGAIAAAQKLLKKK